MKHSQFAFMLLAAGILYIPGISAEAAESNMAIMSCSEGDTLDIKLDNQEVSWSSSDTSIAEIEDGLVVVKGQGKCDLRNDTYGFVIKLNVSGKTSEAGVLSVNYTTDSDKLESVVVRDKTVAVQTVELNSTVTADKSAIPEDFTEVESETSGGSESETYSGVVTDTKDIVNEVEVTAESKGNYLLEGVSGNSEVIKVVKPQLNQYMFQGSVGQTTDINIINLDVPVTYESGDTSIATVDANGHVSLVGEGEVYITIKTENNEMKCKIVSLAPVIDTSEVELDKGETGHIDISYNFAQLPVTYEIIDGEGSVSELGDVTVTGKYVTVKISIGQFSYEKTFTMNTVHEEFWSAMQPAIKQCLGVPYVFGGSSPGSGLDCSGYISFVYRSVGLMSGRWTAQGFYNVAAKTDDPQPGDLVFFHSTYDTYDYVTHIGIYAGNGEMYHSGNPNRKVSLNDAYWQSHFIGYGTMITEDMEAPSVDTVKNTVEQTKGTIYTQEQLELIWAIVGTENNLNYDGALAVITCAMNRASINYGGFGTDVLSQLTAPSQFCYSPEVCDPAVWQARLGGNVPDYVKEAVSDCISNGVRNHEYLSFRSNPVEGQDCVDIGGNWYFQPMN